MYKPQSDQEKIATKVQKEIILNAYIVHPSAE